MKWVDVCTCTWDSTQMLCSCLAPDRRVCTCLSRAILSHSRSCLLALSCRSSFLICSTCQAEPRHCHLFAPTQSDDNYNRNRCSAHRVSATQKDLVPRPCLICEHDFLVWQHSMYCFDLYTWVKVAVEKVTGFCNGDNTRALYNLLIL